MHLIIGAYYRRYYFFFFLFNIIEIKIATNIIAIIARTPAQPSKAIILLPNDIIIPANKTPKVIAEILVLKSSFKKLAAKVPVQAPVPR